MALTKSRGNMYPFVTHTWNAIKGMCFHDCPYCYMKNSMVCFLYGLTPRN